MIDLILWAPDKTTLANFAVSNDLMTRDDEGNLVKRRGFDYSWWAGSGQFKSAARTERVTVAIDQVSLPEIGIRVGNNPPTWVQSGLELENADGDVVADFTRIQGQFAVFTVRTGFVLSVGVSVTAFTPEQYLSGVVALIRIWSDFFDTDRLIPDEADPERGESWARSKVARYIRNNGTAGDIGGITYYELDGVRIFRPADVNNWLSTRGLPGHEWLGGNVY